MSGILGHRRAAAPRCVRSAVLRSCLCSAFLACLVTWPATPSFAEEPAEEEKKEQQQPPKQTLKLDPVIVTASPIAERADELATPVVRVERDEIVENLGSTLGETVGQLPGVSTTGFTAGASRPVIRGQDAFRTEVLEDGLATQDVSQLSPDHAVPVNPINATAIEVVRGPGILRYGGGASAGVVNTITQRIPTERIEDPIEVDVVGSYQSNGDGGDFGTVLRGGIGNFAWHLDGFYRDTDDYETGAGRTQNGTFIDDTWGAAGGGAWIFDAGRLGFAFNRFDAKYGIPEDEPVAIHLRTNRYRFEGDWENPFRGIREINVSGVYSDYEHTERVEGVTGQLYDNEAFDGRLEAHHGEFLGFTGAIGFHGRNQEFEGGGEAAEFLAPSETSTIAAYVFEELPLLETLDFQTGLRIERTWVNGTPITDDRKDRTFFPLSGSVALVSRPTEQLTLAGTFTAGQRAPSQIELFARGPHEATATFELGDPDIDEETSYSGDLRFAGDFDCLRFEASTFATHYDGFIFGSLTGRMLDEDGMPGGDLEELLYLERDATFYGGEVTLGVDLFELFGGTVGTKWQADYVRARFTEGGGDRDVPRITPVRWGGAITYEHDRVSGTLRFLRNENQRDVAANEFATDEFTMLDLILHYQLPLGDGRVQANIDLVARNLLDEKARNAVSFTKDEVLLPGRNFRVNVRIAY